MPIAPLFALLASPHIDLSRVHRVVMMGDSITQIGNGPKGYVTLIDRSLDASRPGDPFEVVNAGISGHKSNDMLARFERDVVAKRPDLVTISVGVNDVWHGFRDFAARRRDPSGSLPNGVPLTDYLRNVEAMIDLAQKAGAQVVLLSPTLVYEDLDCAENRRMAEYVGAEAALAKRRNVGFVNLFALCRDTVRAYQKAAGKRQLVLTVDGVHMNDAGNALMADAVLRFLGVAIPNEVGP